MTRNIIALATAATMSVAVLAPAVQAMDMEFNMLTGAVYQELKQRNLPTEGINDLTLSQIAIIKGIVDSDESEGSKSSRIEAILNR